MGHYASEMGSSARPKTSWERAGSTYEQHFARYFPAGRSDLLVCFKCGAAVADEKIHDEFHGGPADPDNPDRKKK